VHDDSCPCDPRGDLLEQPQPLAADRRFEILKTGEIAIGVRETTDESASNGVRDLDEAEWLRPRCC
jgi:hypothetical protein